MVDTLLMPDFQQHNLDVVDRQHLDQILAAQNFSREGDVSARDEISLGRVLGPSVLVFVKIYECAPDMQHLQNNERNYLNNTAQAIYISQTRFSVKGSVEIADLTTGQVLGSTPFESHEQRQTQSVQGPPEFPPQDEVKQASMSDAGKQIHSTFFPWTESVPLVFYDDKDCGLKDVYDLYQRGDHDGSRKLAESSLVQCKGAHKNEKSLVRAYYDVGLAYLLAGQFDKCSEYFTQAMQSKGAEAAGVASEACGRAQAGADQVKRYEAKLASLPAPAPINFSAQAPPPQAAAPAPQQSTQADASPAGAAAKPSAEVRLKKLDDLYKQGLITKKDYDAKKAEILSEL